MSDPRYPIGRFEWPTNVTAEERAVLLERLAAAPGHLRDLVTGLTRRPATRYSLHREGGWTVRHGVFIIFLTAT